MRPIQKLPAPSTYRPTTSPRSNASVRSQNGSMMPIRCRTSRRSNAPIGIAAQLEIGEDRAHAEAQHDGGEQRLREERREHDARDQ